MYNIISPITSIGLEFAPSGLKGATVAIQGKSIVLTRLLDLAAESEDVKPLYIGHPYITTGFDGKEVIVRHMHMAVTKDKDIEEALAFQAEPLLPFPIEEAVLTYQILAKDQDGTDLTLLAVRNSAMEGHLEKCKAAKIVPERVACIQTALSQFGNRYLPAAKTYLIFHLDRRHITAVLIKENRLFASFALTDGLEALLSHRDHLPERFPQNEEGWNKTQEGEPSTLSESLKKLQKEISKITFALGKEIKGQAIEGILLTGEAAEYNGLCQTLTRNLPFPLLQVEATDEFSAQKLQSYAVPIGLALGALPGQSAMIDFRKQAWSYPHPWKRLVTPLAAYFCSLLFVCFAFYFFGQHYLSYKEDQLRQTYVDMIGGRHKTYPQFELAYLAKHPKAHDRYDGEIPTVTQLDREALKERLSFLQHEIQAAPESFPLHPNIPRVSDVLAWLTQHPAVVSSDEEGYPEVRLQIQNFSYTMVKRPQQDRKQEKYQVKIELEFTSPTPKWAREFHDALIAPNDWVDPKGEVKWNTNRGSYRTSFFLRDKTVYPSGS